MASELCEACESFFGRFSCGAGVGDGECDCPRCQGLCECGAAEDAAEDDGQPTEYEEWQDLPWGGDDALPGLSEE